VDLVDLCLLVDLGVLVYLYHLEGLVVLLNRQGLEDLVNLEDLVDQFGLVDPLDLANLEDQECIQDMPLVVLQLLLLFGVLEKRGSRLGFLEPHMKKQHGLMKTDQEQLSIQNLFEKLLLVVGFLWSQEFV
jgi:hypothetical protein